VVPSPIGHKSPSMAGILRSGTVVLHYPCENRYFGIDAAIVWSVVGRDLPDLERKIGIILDELGAQARLDAWN
jgi:hypothetical protein